MQDDPRGLRQKSNHELIQEAAGWKQGHANYIAAMRELERRSQRPTLRRANLALLVAFGSFLISAVVAARVFGVL